MLLEARRKQLRHGKRAHASRLRLRLLLLLLAIRDGCRQEDSCSARRGG